MNNENLKKLISNLPNIPGILGINEYFNSAVLVPFFFVDGEYHLLFEKRAAKISQGGEICFPGGGIEDSDENSTKTAIRETEEEIGISNDKITVLGKLDTLIGPRGITVEPIVAELKMNSIEECILDKTEVEKVFSVPVSYFKQNKPSSYKVHSKINYKMFNENGEEESLIPLNSQEKSYTENVRDVLVYKTNGEVIWGITARLIFEIINKY